MRARAPLLLGSLFLGSCLWTAAPAAAGLRVVQGEGYAAIAGNDVARARKAALAEALYNAAGRVKTKIRGAGHLDTRGVMTEESSMLVEGSLRDHRIVQEYREGSRYVVIVEALAETDGSACGTKRVDLDVRPIARAASRGDSPPSLACSAPATQTSPLRTATPNRATKPTPAAIEKGMPRRANAAIPPEAATGTAQKISAASRSDLKLA